MRPEYVGGNVLDYGRGSTMPDDRASAPRRRDHADASGPASDVGVREATGGESGIHRADVPASRR